MIAQGDFMGVPPEVPDHGLRPGKRSFAINHPGLLKEGFKEVLGLPDLFTELPDKAGLKDFAEGFYREEEFSFLFGLLPATFFSDPTGRHNTMEVGVQGEVLSPGMQ